MNQPINNIENDLFTEISEQPQNNPAILLVDASASVKSKFDPNNLIFDFMVEAIKKINCNLFRIIFWNSNQNDEEHLTLFPKGVIVLPNVIEKRLIKQTFSIFKQKIEGPCLTFPHLAFEAIPKEWINNTQATHIYFITDGQIGYGGCESRELTNLKTSLQNQIERIFKVYNNVHLHIITIEDKKVDYTQVETINTMAGGDVFQLIQANGLTKYVTEFVSYAQNNIEGFHHINTIIPPKGFITFGTKCFSELKTYDFIRYLKDFVTANSQNEDELLKVVQKLTKTINALIKDKQINIASNIIRTFCNIFKGTCIDFAIIEMMLHDTITLENQGKAFVFAEYRAKLRDLYKQAQLMLQHDTKRVIGMENEFATFPINNTIISGRSTLVCESIKLRNCTFPNSSIKIANHVIPVVPILDEFPSQMNEQCLRQYIRSIISAQFGGDNMSDLMIYYVLGQNLRIAMSNLPEKIKKSFRILSTIMLKKKRLNTNISELEKLESGDLPIPNMGDINTFYGYMADIKNKLSIKCSNMTLWYAMCCALNNPVLTVKQLIHCNDDIRKDFPNIQSNLLLETLQPQFVTSNINIFEIPKEYSYEYKCVITMDDTTMTGGYRYKEHKSLTNNDCFPNFIISELGYNAMFEHGNVMCPVCYSRLTAENFEKVPPRPNIDFKQFDNTFINPFNNRMPIPTQIPIQFPTPILNNQNVNNGKRKILIVMKGTVGSGKSTFSEQLQARLLSIGTVFCEGTDKYCIRGDNIKTACAKVHSTLMKASRYNQPVVIVIIDTCGDRFIPSNVFGVNFSDFEIFEVYPNLFENNIDGYLAWTLSNVLKRTQSLPNSNFWLNPIAVPPVKCMSIHFDKAYGLFGNKVNRITKKTELNEILEDIKQKALEYSEILKQEPNSLTNQIENLVKRIFK